MKIDQVESVSRLVVTVDCETRIVLPEIANASPPRDTYEILVRDSYPGTSAVLIQGISRQALVAFIRQALGELL